MYRLTDVSRSIPLASLSLALLLPTAWGRNAIRYVSPAGDDANSGLDAESPWVSPQKAVDAVGDTGTVYLLEGDYPLASPLTITNGVQVLGAGRETTVLRAAGKGYPVVDLDHPEAVLAKVTITGGQNINCGGGFLIGPDGGTIRDSMIVDNKTTGYQARGGGGVMEAGTLLRCIVKRNRFTSYGNIYAGGVWQKGETIDNCLITENVSSTTAGGIYRDNGVIRNSTIAGNIAHSACGGLLVNGNGRKGDVVNCIITGNLCPRDTSIGSPDWSCWGTARDCFQNCATPVAIGTNCVTAPVEFVNPENGDYRLRAYSPCVNAGRAIPGGSELDVAGNPRTEGAAIDIGAHELGESVLSCEISATPAKIFKGEKVVLEAHLIGDTGEEPISYDWTLKAPDGRTETFSGKTMTKTLSTYGVYGISLAVTCGAETVTATRTNDLCVLPATSYVVVAGSNTPAYPYATPETAANDVATAIAAAKDGATILVAEGVYALPAALQIDKPVHLLGPKGHKTTILRQTADERVLVLNQADAIVEGFTMTGARMNENDQSYGAGVYIGAKGGTVRNCRITGNSAKSWHTRGVGLAMIGDQGLVSHCIIDHNQAPLDPTGGGAYLHGGLMDNCLVYGNKATYSAGVHLCDGASLQNCTITKNTVKTTTGGLGANGNGKSSVLNCIIVGNEAPNDSSVGKPEWSGGNSGGTIRHCHTGAAAPIGTDCAAGPTDFVDFANDDFHLLASSACIEKGENAEGIAATDLDGRQRVSGASVDIGCYEYDLGQLSCGFSCRSREIFSDEQGVFTATVSGLDADKVDFEYQWSFSDGVHEPFKNYDIDPAIDFPHPGLYSVSLLVTRREDSSQRASFERKDYLLVVPRTTYLVAKNPDAAYPYDSWERAATDIHLLVGKAIDGSHHRNRRGDPYDHQHDRPGQGGHHPGSQGTGQDGSLALDRRRTIPDHLHEQSWRLCRRPHHHRGLSGKRRGRPRRGCPHRQQRRDPERLPRHRELRRQLALPRERDRGHGGKRTRPPMRHRRQQRQDGRDPGRSRRHEGPRGKLPRL